MKCPNCGAEIGNGKICQYCGSQISAGMQRQQEQLIKQGCPKCGSTNIQFRRENQGEIRGKKAKQNVYATVGFCKDCGNTWYTNVNYTGKNKKKWYIILLWVLGWIYIFPIPLTILMLRRKDIKNTVKYGIIAAGWAVYILSLVIFGSSSKNDKINETAESPAQITDIAENTEIHLYDKAQVRDLLNGFRTEKVGEYAVIFADSGECTEEALADLYFNYYIKNTFNWLAVIYSDKSDNSGIYMNKGTIIVNTAFEEDEYGEYSTKSMPDEILYYPSDDGETIVKFD